MNSKLTNSDTPKFVANYIENFIDFVENVPNDLSRKITRIHELQLDYESFLGKLENNLTRFSKQNANELKQLKLLLETQHCLVRMQELSDVKLSITQDAYDQLDNKSRELDYNFQLINVATSDGTEGTSTTNSSSNKNSKNSVKVVSSSSSQAKTQSPEPTYCICHQVSYGDMICCDNAACEVEWFHFLCVSLTSKPKGKWYCPNCRGDRSNQPKK